MRAIESVLQPLARALPHAPHAVWLGMTGYEAGAKVPLEPLLTRVFGLGAGRARAMSDIELLCRGAFVPGQGIVVYAGTGAVAARLDADGTLQRAGGRGVVLDDAGGGHWIACTALRAVWRAEDEEPGQWRRSILAQRLFERVGGSDWAHTRRYVYGSARGEVGALALAVAAAASEGDPEALALLRQAGIELARLGHALLRRAGAQPVALAGRVFELHPAVATALAAALPPGTTMRRLDDAPHVAAARGALRELAGAGP
jgi:glucosamine kinase